MTLSVEEVRNQLAQPNGPARIDLEAAWEGLQILVLEKGDSQALSAWVRAAKRKEYRQKILACLCVERMAALLQDPSAKVRKNAARLAGALGREADAPALAEALRGETIRMVRPSQILALGALGQAETLRGYVVPPPEDASAEKHAQQEKEALQTALSAVTESVHHKVRGLPRGLPAELVVPEQMEKTVIRELHAVGLEGRQSARGRVELELSSYKALLQVRSWRELLFPLVTFEGPPEKWGQILEKRIGRRFRTLLEKVYEGPPPYAYRIELRGGADRSTIIRKIAEALEHPDLQNSTSDYETELRIEPHGRHVTAYVRFCTLPDPRFAYRKGTVAASIHPAAAAAVMEWAAPYLLPNAKVLDPCCGSGTMLIERARFDTCSTLFGIDISRQAIRIAEDNLEAAGLEGRCIVKDCTQFTAKDRFDEVISNLPFGNRVGDHETNEVLYDALFSRLGGWLKPGGIAVLYTMEVGLIRKMLQKYRGAMRLRAGIRTEAGGLDPGIYIIQVGGNL